MPNLKTFRNFEGERGAFLTASLNTADAKSLGLSLKSRTERSLIN